MLTLFEMRFNCWKWKRELTQIKSDLICRRLAQTGFKAGFRENQLRDAAGKWTLENGIEVTTTPGFLTGITEIDDTSQALGDILARVMGGLEYLPTMKPGAYGVVVHAAFGIAVRLKNLPGVGDIERSFSLEDADPYYGLAGTVRTDVTLRNIQGDIIAIYDVKTGDRRMSRARADELREKTGSSPNTPVFELNVLRGISRKSFSLSENGSADRPWVRCLTVWRA